MKIVFWTSKKGQSLWLVVRSFSLHTGTISIHLELLSCSTVRHWILPFSNPAMLISLNSGSRGLLVPFRFKNPHLNGREMPRNSKSIWLSRTKTYGISLAAASSADSKTSTPWCSATEFSSFGVGQEWPKGINGRLEFFRGYPRKPVPSSMSIIFTLSLAFQLPHLHCAVVQDSKTHLKSFQTNLLCLKYCANL